MSDRLDSVILLPRLRVQNANAISGPLTWGFPAPTAFTGFVHALQRKFGDENASLDGVGIVCHRFDPQVYTPAGKYHHCFRLARHPMGKKGKPTRTVEEGRAHLEVSLLIGMQGYLDEEDGQMLAERVHQTTMGMRLAGGTILPTLPGKRYQAAYCELSGTQEGDEGVFRQLRRRLLPGFALVSRHKLLQEHLLALWEKDPTATAIEALLELTALHIDPLDDPENPDQAAWQSSRILPGWLVPLPVGYSAITPLHEPGTVKNARDSTTPFRFVESLYSLGEWLSPHRLQQPKELLWFHRADTAAGLYLCEHQQTNA